MEDVAESQPVTQQTQLLTLLKLERQFQTGLNWFYWIAGLSLLNSLIILLGGSWSFIVGLGITQIIDGFALGLSEIISDSGVILVRAMAFLMILGVTGLFALFGVLGKRGFKSVVIIGMILYALDGLIFLLLGDLLSVGFHLIALWGLVGGLKAYQKLERVANWRELLASGPGEDWLLTADYMPQEKPVRNRNYWRKLLIPALILLLPFVVFLALLLFNL
jgi:hypothetical protein